ncbi:Short-chain dehydrogenase/reductase SDR [Lachnospiraceae bacterium TWA4]|nr:Short-chain dehydrogenase/reductase SDR [Lachnospiraceae bacterium TWA4]
MSKKTVVVVGAGKGMGNHIAKKFAQNDFRVVLMARSEERLGQYKKEFEEEGFEVATKSVDAANTESLKDAFDWVKSEFGVVDVLVYNAAILEAGFPTTLSNEEFMKHYQVDVASALFCANQVIPAQLEQKEGTILFTGGGFALYPMAEYTCVSVGKAALRALAFTLNQELSEKGIFTGIVTIMGNIAKNTPYDPELIAEKYWELYTNRKDVEVVFK